MIEDSVENFIIKWKPYAVRLELYPTIEGSPLLECGVLGKIFHLFDRTGPYESLLALMQHKRYLDVIVHPIIESLRVLNDPVKNFTVTSVSKIHAKGLILRRSDPFIILDVGIPLVAASFEPLPENVAAGDWLEITSQSPIHGFVVSPVRQLSYAGAGEI